MKMRLWLFGVGLLLFATEALAVDIEGTVREASGGSATIVTQSELLPNVGDKVDIFFRIPGTSDEVSVGSGRVSAVSGDSIQVNVEQATGEVAKDHVARVHSENPTKRAAAATPAPPPAAAAPATGQGTQPPPSVGKAGEETLSFDRVAPGALSPDAFAGHGMRVMTGKGTPRVSTAEPNMVLPQGSKHVLLNSPFGGTGDRQTSLAITFDQPIKRFSLTRIGTANGASVPTWTLRAYDRNGKVVASTGEEHGLPPQPREVSVQGSGIVRVELSTDNRFGAGTWASWNSLPVTGFTITR